MSDRPRSGLLRSRRVRIGLAAAIVAIGTVAIAGYEYEKQRTGSIYHPHARFIPQPTPTLPAKGPERFAWDRKSGV